MAGFAAQLLGLPSLAPLAVPLRQLVEAEAGPTTPLLFITSPGADPCPELAEAAAAVAGKEGFHEVAMGQGQAELAVQLLRECAQSGACWGTKGRRLK